MVGDNRDGLRGAVQPGAHVAERLDDGEEFLVVDLVVNLGRRELAQEEPNRVQKTVIIGLLEHARDSEI